MAWYYTILNYLWDIFKLWLETLFAAPFRNLDMLWLLVPVWLGWFFAEFFQEKQGTSMGNAISNSVIVIWGGIDCMRQTVRLIGAGILKGFGNLSLRFTLAVLIIGYGIMIIWFGIKGDKVVSNIGRIREVTYVILMFTPIFYNVIPFSINHLVAFVLFFPVFYFTIELLDKYVPNPRAIIEDNQRY